MVACRSATLGTFIAVRSHAGSLPPGKNLLFVVDEPAKTGVPANVRDLLFNQWFGDHLDARMFIASPNPAKLVVCGVAGHVRDSPSQGSSDFKMTWVPLSVPGPADVGCIVNKLPWNANDKIQALLCHLMALPSSDWRARDEMWDVVKVSPRPPSDTLPFLTSAQAAVSKVREQVNSYFELSPKNVLAVNERPPVASVLRCRLPLVAAEDESVQWKFAGRPPSYWLLAGVLSNGSYGLGESFSVFSAASTLRQ